MNKISQLGGLASMKKKTKKERIQFAKIGARARWDKYYVEKAKKEAEREKRRVRARARRA